MQFLEIAEKWYIHKPENVLEYKDCKILWGFPIQIEKTLDYNQPDITVIDKKSEECLLIDPACPFDTLIEKIEEEECTNYGELKYEIARIWKIRKVEVILVLIGTLGTVTKPFEKWVDKLGLDMAIEALQKPCLLGAASLIQKMLDMK